VSVSLDLDDEYLALFLVLHKIKLCSRAKYYVPLTIVTSAGLTVFASQTPDLFIFRGFGMCPPLDPEAELPLASAVVVVKSTVRWRPCLSSAIVPRPVNRAFVGRIDVDLLAGKRPCALCRLTVRGGCVGELSCAIVAPVGSCPKLRGAAGARFPPFLLRRTHVLHHPIFCVTSLRGRLLCPLIPDQCPAVDSLFSFLFTSTALPKLPRLESPSHATFSRHRPTPEHSHGGGRRLPRPGVQTAAEVFSYALHFHCTLTPSPPHQKKGRKKKHKKKKKGGKGSHKKRNPPPPSPRKDPPCRRREVCCP